MAQPPQSAAPLGQGPLASVGRVNVSNTVPSVLDTSNLFNTQTAISNAIGTSLRQRQQALTEQKFLIGQTEKVLNAQKEAFNSLYGNLKSKKAQGAGLLGSDLLLDPTYNKNRAINERVQARIQATEEELNKIFEGVLSGSNATNPALQAEALRRSQNLINQANRELDGDVEYREALINERRIDQFLEDARKATAAGRDIDVGTLDKRINKFNAYRNGEPGVVLNDNDFTLDDIIFNGAQGIKDFNTAIANAFSPETEQGLVEGPDGTQFTAEQTRIRTLEEAMPGLVNRLGASKDFVRTYEAYKAAGGDKTFEEYVRGMAEPFAPVTPERQTKIGTRPAFDPLAREATRAKIDASKALAASRRAKASGGGGKSSGKKGGGTGSKKGKGSSVSLDDDKYEGISGKEELEKALGEIPDTDAFKGYRDDLLAKAEELAELLGIEKEARLSREQKKRKAELQEELDPDNIRKKLKEGKATIGTKAVAEEQATTIIQSIPDDDQGVTIPVLKVKAGENKRNVRGKTALRWLGLPKGVLDLIVGDKDNATDIRIKKSTGGKYLLEFQKEGKSLESKMLTEEELSAVLSAMAEDGQIEGFEVDENAAQAKAEEVIEEEQNTPSMMDKLKRNAGS